MRRCWDLSLTQAHYAGAIPIDLLKTEQERLSSQLQHVHDRLDSATTNYERIRDTLADTLDLTRDCHTAYLNADDSTRRLFNQAFFARIWIHEDPVTAGHSVRVDYNEPFDDLLSRLIPAHAHQLLTQQETAHQADLVGGDSCTAGVRRGRVALRAFWWS